MKKFVITTVLGLMSFGFYAQNLNVKSETKTEVTTVKDSKGVKEVEKKVVTKEFQDVKVDDSKRHGKNGRNMPQVTTNPVEVVETTSVSVDGDVKYVDVDRSAYYTYNGKKYELKRNDNGYTFHSNNGNKNGFLRKTSDNHYIYVKGNEMSVGHFNAEGNLVIDTYDKKSDSIITTIYTSAK
ncbi:MAG: hypothetical protein KYX68_10720 [Flavobacterium sp.]|nr:hypothetical protein [Flavobacterium sp.]